MVQHVLMVHINNRQPPSRAVANAHAIRHRRLAGLTQRWVAAVVACRDHGLSGSLLLEVPGYNLLINLDILSFKPISRHFRTEMTF